MKRNSSHTLSTLPEAEYTESKKAIKNGCAGSWSRRSVLAALGTLFLMPRYTLAQVFQCGSNFRIATIAALTGAFAQTRPGYHMGISDAANRANDQGCRVQLFIQDSPPTPDGLLMQTLMAVNKDRASVIFAAFGPAAYMVAEKVSSALIFDLKQTFLAESRPRNLVSLPYSIFFTVNPELRYNSLYTLGSVAANILFDTIRSSAPGSITSPSSMIEAMAKRKFKTPKGALALNRQSGVFELL